MRSHSEADLSPEETRDLSCIAGMMIPASAEFGVPGADDPIIVTDILRSLGRDRDDVRSALDIMRTMAEGALADLDAVRAKRVVETFLASTDPAAAVLGRVVLQCYYRDDRVLRSVQHEPRPPFPKGNTLEQGDWSLLDAVRGRAKMWRD
ncbi:MAG TPA: hypothetical protein VGC09_15790 [Rhodopila sp.]